VEKAIDTKSKYDAPVRRVTSRSPKPRHRPQPYESKLLSYTQRGKAIDNKKSKRDAQKRRATSRSTKPRRRPQPCESKLLSCT